MIRRALSPSRPGCTGEVVSNGLEHRRAPERQRRGRRQEDAGQCHPAVEIAQRAGEQIVEIDCTDGLDRGLVVSGGGRQDHDPGIERRARRRDHPRPDAEAGLGPKSGVERRDHRPDGIPHEGAREPGPAGEEEGERAEGNRPSAGGVGQITDREIRRPAPFGPGEEAGDPEHDRALVVGVGPGPGPSRDGRPEEIHRARGAEAGDHDRGHHGVAAMVGQQAPGLRHPTGEQGIDQLDAPRVARHRVGERRAPATAPAGDARDIDRAQPVDDPSDGRRLVRGPASHQGQSGGADRDLAALEAGRAGLPGLAVDLDGHSVEGVGQVTGRRQVDADQAGAGLRDRARSSLRRSHCVSCCFM